MSPLRKGKKKKAEKEAETREVAEAVPEAEIEMPREVEVAQPQVAKPREEVSPPLWWSQFVDLSEVQNDLKSLPDLDLQLNIGSSMVRLVKKGLAKPAITEERSLRPDVIVRISEKAWKEVSASQNLDDFINQYRKYSKSQSPEAFIKVSINKDRLLSDGGVLRSRLFKNLLLI